MTDFRYVGKDDSVFNTQDKAAGAALYACDLHLPRMLQMKLILSPVAHGRVRSVDASEAEKVPGVAAILTWQDVPQTKYNRGRVRASEEIPDQETIFTDHVRFVGDRIGAVLAETKEAAEEAASLIKLDIEEYPAYLSPQQVLAGTKVPIHETDQVIVPEVVAFGDYEAEQGEELQLLSSSERTTHIAMEPHCAVASYHPASKSMEVWTATQSVFGARSAVATLFGLDMQKVRVYKSPMGGSFGCKQEMILEPLVAAASIATGRPVKLELSRAEVMMCTVLRHPIDVLTRGKFDEDLQLKGVRLDILLDAGAYQTISPDYCLSMAKKINWTYDLQSAEVHSASVCTNTPVSGSYRGWGGPELCFVMENFMNMAARRYGVDPIVLRKKNVLPPWSVTKVLNFNLGSLPFEQVMDKGAALFGWEEKRKVLAEQGHRCGKDGTPDPAGRYLRGVGMAICTHTSGYFPRRPDWGTLSMKMEEDGSVSVNVNIHDHGCGSVMAFQKIAGEVLCMDPGKIAIPEGDTLYNAIDNGCYTSRSVFVLGRAVMETAKELKEQILDYAEKLLETPKEELVCEDSRVFPAADPDKSLSYSDIAYYAADKAHGALFVTHTYEPASNAGPVSADFAEVEVDTYTGHCRLTDFACVHDIGKAINPEVCRSQIGSAVQNGAGMVFCEQIRIDPKTGAIQNTSMERYHVVRAAELPNVKVEFLEDESADGPFGAKSIGEAALVPVVPAILAALNDALGSGFSAVPVTPDKVLSFLESAGKEAAR